MHHIRKPLICDVPTKKLDKKSNDCEMDSLIR